MAMGLLAAFPDKKVVGELVTSVDITLVLASRIAGLIGESGMSGQRCAKLEGFLVAYFAKEGLGEASVLNSSKPSESLPLAIRVHVLLSFGVENLTIWANGENWLKTFGGASLRPESECLRVASGCFLAASSYRLKCSIDGNLVLITENIHKNISEVTPAVTLL